MSLLLLLSAVGLTVPGIVLRFTDFGLGPWGEAAFFGLAVLGGALLLAWAAEVAQVEISQALSLALLALVAVLPEYAVDLYFAWHAADHPSYAHYATANMTGANRLLVGMGWPLVVLLFFARFRKRHVTLPRLARIDVATLGLATVYAFTIPLRGGLSLVDTVVLVSLFAYYVWRTSKAEKQEPNLAGPSRTLAQLPQGRRRALTILMFLYSGAAILLVAQPFAESLIQAGRSAGVDEFLLVQWIAPLASEAPEFIIAGMWALRGLPDDGLSALVSSKVNQWTLLIGTLPLVYSINLGAPGRLPLDTRQEHEILLTAAQSLLAVSLLADRNLGIFEALLLLVLFLAQLVYPDIRLEATIVYVLLAVALLVRRRRAAGATLATLKPSRARRRTRSRTSN